MTLRALVGSTVIGIMTGSRITRRRSSRPCDFCKWWQKLVIAMLLLSSCGEDIQPGHDPVPYELLPSNTLSNATITFVDSLQTKAIVHAGQVQWYPSEQQTLLDSSVYVEFYAASGRVAARLWCDSAKVENATSNMWAYGHVRVISDSTGVRLQTHSLRWDNRRRRLLTSDYVRVERPGEIVEGGYGFESDEYLKHYTIFNVQGSVHP